MFCQRIIFALILTAITASAARNEDVNLGKIDDYDMLDPVVVTATRTERRLAESTVATELVGREELVRSGTQDLAEFLEMRAGVSVTHGVFGSGIQVQGLGSEYVLILVDGERAGGRKNGVIDLSRYALNGIERIEIVKGNQSALYGSDAVGGVINIITRGSSAPVESHFEVQGGSTGEIDLGTSVGFRGKVWNSRLSAGWRSAAAQDLNASDPETTVDAADEFSLQGQSTWWLNDLSKLETRLRYHRRRQEGVDGGTDTSTAIFDRRNLIENFTFSISPTIWLHGSNRLKASAYVSIYRDEYLHDQRGSSAMDQYQETWERMLQLSLQADRAFSGGHLLSLGAEGFHEDLDTERLTDGHSGRDRLGLYLQDELTTGKGGRLTVLPGLRLDADTQFGRHLTPRLALRFDAGKKVILRGSLGQGFRAPDFKELYVHFVHPAVGYEITGNPDLLPELSLSGSLGLEVNPTARVSLTLSAYHHDFDNLIQGILTSEVNDAGLTVGTYVNISQATLRGADLGLRFLPAVNLNFDVGYSYLDSRDEVTGTVLEGRPRHRASFNMNWQVLSTNLGLRATWVGERSFREAYSGVASTTAAPYALLDLRAGRSISQWLSISAGVKNALDAGDHEYLRIAPRRIWLGIELDRSVTRESAQS